MAFPAPTPGLVIRYSYLWMAEHARGQEEGVKDRPCAIILMSVDEADDQVVRAAKALPLHSAHGTGCPLEPQPQGVPP